MKETPIQKEAFETYCRLGFERTYAKIGVKFGRAIRTVEKWGRDLNWQVRVQEWESNNRKKAAERQEVEQEVDWLQRDLKIVKRAIYEHAKAISNGDLKPTYKSLESLMNLEIKLRTGYDQSISVRHQLDVKNLSNDQVKLRILEEVQKLQRISSLKRVLSEDELDAIEVEFTTGGEKREREPIRIEAGNGIEKGNS